MVSSMRGMKFGKGIKNLFKVLISLVCIWYISYKIDFRQLSGILARTQYIWMVFAVLSFLFSKLLASFRLNIYFRNIHIHLSEWKNIKLYLLGMFYNLFLPGSISGDGYKVIRLTKEYGVPYKKTAAAVLLDRLSGLIALVLLLAICWITVFGAFPNGVWAMAGAVGLIALFYMVTKWVFPSFVDSFWSTFIFGMAVQVLQVASMYCVLRALHIELHLVEYILIFLASSVVAVLPFTIGGLGARELIFLWGANVFGFDSTVSVTASALFYLTTVISSSFGLYFIFSDPLKSSGPKSGEIQYATEN